MIIQKLINIVGIYPLYAKIIAKLSLENFGKWRLRRFGKKDIKFKTLKSGLVALRLEVVNQGSRAEIHDLSNGYQYVKTSLHNPFSCFEYTIEHGRLNRNKLQYPFIIWLKEQFIVWFSLLSFAVLVIALSRFNGQFAHHLFISAGTLIFILGLFLSVPNPPKRSPNYPLINFIPFLLTGIFTVIEVHRPNMLLAANYTDEFNSKITDIQATSDPEKMLIVAGNDGSYVVSGGNLYINVPVDIKKFYFDSKKEKTAVIFLCDIKDKCITAWEPEF